MPPVTRIFGPYPHNGGFRCQVAVDGRRTWAPMADSPQRAEHLAQRFIDGIHAAHPITIAEAIEQYRLTLIEKGNKPDSIKATECRMLLFFASVRDRPVMTLTQARGQALYETLRTTISQRTGKPLAAATHRNMLIEARTFLAWCVERRMLRQNPLATVKGIGKRRHGKPQLRIDEARKLRELCHALAMAGEDGPVAVLMGLLMGMRAGEIVTRSVRDLDDGGRLLWIPDAKTEAGKRTLEIPEELRPYLLARAEGKPPHALIFTAKRNGKHWRDWVREETGRLCKLAGVPPVCAHSLRGFMATIAIQAGGASHLVTATLGHVSINTTLQSYAARGSAQIAQQRRGIEVLDRPAVGLVNPPMPN